MPPKTMEERMTELEQKVAHILGEKPTVAPETTPDLAKLPAWLRKHVGAFKNDPYYEAAMQSGAAYRRSQPTGAEEWDALEAERVKAGKTNEPV